MVKLKVAVLTRCSPHLLPSTGHPFAIPTNIATKRRETHAFVRVSGYGITTSIVCTVLKEPNVVNDGRELASDASSKLEKGEK
jgi:hypothetical protein